MAGKFAGMTEADRLQEVERLQNSAENNGDEGDALQGWVDTANYFEQAFPDMDETTHSEYRLLLMKIVKRFYKENTYKNDKRFVWLLINYVESWVHEDSPMQRIKYFVHLIDSGRGDKSSSIYLKLANLYKTVGNPKQASKMLSKAIENDEQLLNEMLGHLQLNGAAGLPETTLKESENDSGNGSSLSSSNLKTAENNSNQTTIISPSENLSGVVNTASNDSVASTTNSANPRPSNSQLVEERNHISKERYFFQNIQYLSLPENNTADFISMKENRWWELSDRSEIFELKKLAEELLLINNENFDKANAALLKKNVEIKRLEEELKECQAENQRLLQEKLGAANTPQQLRNAKKTLPQMQKSSCVRNNAFASAGPGRPSSFGSPIQPQAQFHKKPLGKEVSATSRAKPGVAGFKSMAPSAGSRSTTPSRYGSARHYSRALRPNPQSDLSNPSFVPDNFGLSVAGTPAPSFSTLRKECNAGNVDTPVSSRHSIPDPPFATPLSALRKTPSAAGQKRVHFSTPTLSPESTIICASPPFDSDDAEEDEDVITLDQDQESIDWADLTTALMDRPKPINNSTPGVERSLSCKVSTTSQQITGYTPSATPAGNRTGQRLSCTFSEDSFESCGSFLRTFDSR